MALQMAAGCIHGCQCAHAQCDSDSDTKALAAEAAEEGQVTKGACTMTPELRLLRLFRSAIVGDSR